ncbi:MAG TPA: molybdenum cofactor guanylyltransferase [Pirellulaceae bacterium]|nr:molybdenum cofactor guanylyltransferase [Pirellulaceae bacterium]HMO93712.1 molybdenum cofactor guanylyltransferase [Pirellulaceae bacterium]HMP69785.1 molybdenum cofactor guanylyltransferase [Pirellulaceae bacterium]
MTSNEQNQHAGVILAGGQSRRMGRDKRVLHFRERPLIEHVISALCEFTEILVVVDRRQSTLSQELIDAKRILEIDSVHWLYDELSDIGPLEGVRVAFDWLNHSQTNCEAALLVGCDFPLFLPSVGRRLFALLEDHEAVCFVDDCKRKPLPGVYRIAILPKIMQLLANGQRSLQSLLNAIDCKEVHEDAIRDIDPQLTSLKNINTENELQALRLRFGM